VNVERDKPPRHSTSEKKPNTMKTYSVFNGKEEITQTKDGYWKESWTGDEYDTLGELLDDLADHEKAQVEKEIEAQDSK